MSKKIKNIAYISGTRADFGLMSPVLQAIDRHPNFNLKLYATGVHLMEQFGLTINQIKKQFPTVKKIPAFFTSDEKDGMAHFAADYMKQVINILSHDRPDFILILGDRVEMVCTALTALYLKIPTGHLHGGERTSTVDEIARHAITKLASLHFASSKDAAKRIKKLGEDPWRIHIVGAPSLDIILNEKLPGREELFNKIGINPKERVIFLVQHPVSEDIDHAGEQIEKTIAAIKVFNMHTVVIYPHPDPGGRRMIKVIEKESHNPLFHLVPSLEFKDFLALEKEAEVLVGNSSAGMIESPSFGLPVVNVGNRQRNRLRGKNVIDTGYDKDAIVKAIEKSLFDEKYRKALKKIKNPWGDGHCSERIVNIISNTEINDKLLGKQITY